MRYFNSSAYKSDRYILSHTHLQTKDIHYNIDHVICYALLMLACSTAPNRSSQCLITALDHTVLNMMTCSFAPDNKVLIMMACSYAHAPSLRITPLYLACSVYALCCLQGTIEFFFSVSVFMLLHFLSLHRCFTTGNTVNTPTFCSLCSL